MVLLSLATLVAAASLGACAPAVHVHELPAWAAGGFSGPDPTAPFAVGRHGRIAAIVFGRPLTVPPRPNRSNKILWVARQPAKPGHDLVIHAQRLQGTRPVGAPVRRVVAGGPGPSRIDVPVAGCWRFTLSWSHGSDSIDLTYRKR